MEAVRGADGHPIDRVWVTSPFDSRLRYNLYSTFVILPTHQLRHVVQAERVWERTCGHFELERTQKHTHSRAGSA